MHRIFKENYNLIIKDFDPMCFRRKNSIAVLYRLGVIRVKLYRTEK